MVQNIGKLHFRMISALRFREHIEEEEVMREEIIHYQRNRAGGDGALRIRGEADLSHHCMWPVRFRRKQDFILGWVAGYPSDISPDGEVECLAEGLVILTFGMSDCEITRGNNRFQGKISARLCRMEKGTIRTTKIYGKT